MNSLRNFFIYFTLGALTVTVLYSCKKGDTGSGPGPSNPVVPPPVISSISPDNGTWSTIVTITGSGFSTNPADNVVKFNDSVATISSATANQLVVAVPKRAGAGAVTVSAKGGEVTGPVFNYTYLVSISTLAGSGNSGYADGTGTSAVFNNIYFACSDAQGNIYVADGGNNKIRKITPSGTASTMAGSVSGFADGNAATAKFTNPIGVCLDAQGNIYVTDQGNNKIRKITPSGVVSTFAGSTSGSADGTALTAQFASPGGIGSDSQGNIYVADFGNTKIRKITPSGVVGTFAGGTDGSADGNATAAQFHGPGGICSDSQGNIYIADWGNNKIRKITPAGVVSTLAGGPQGFADGDAANAQFNQPEGICLDVRGNLYVTDFGNNKIRKITASGVVSTIAGSSQGFGDGGPTAAKFNGPWGICADVQGNLYVTDKGNYRIRKITIE